MSQMNAKVLGLAALAVMVTMLFVQTQQEPPPPATNLILPGLQSSLPEVTRVSISEPAGDGVAATLEKQGEKWVVLEKDNYPADFATLSRLLDDLATLRIRETKTARPENHEKLGLGASGENAGTLITIEAGSAMALMVGRAGTSGGTFVRLPDSDQVYLTNTIDASADPMAYVDPVIINVDSAEVMTVEISSGGALLSAARSESTGEMTVMNLPENAELKYATVADSLARLLVNLRFTDVRPYEQANFASPSVATIQTRSGKTLRAMTVQYDEGYWLQLDDESTRDWQYRISEYTYNELNKSLADLLKSDELDAT